MSKATGRHIQTEYEDVRAEKAITVIMDDKYIHKYNINNNADNII